MKNLFTIIICLITLVGCGSSRAVVNKASEQEKVSALVDVANHYQEMIAENPDYVYIDDEFKDGELNIGLDMWLTPNCKGGQKIYLIKDKFTDINGKNFSCMCAGIYGYPRNANVIGTNVIAFELLGERPLDVYFVFGGRYSESKLMSTILGNFYPKADLSPIYWSVPLGTYKFTDNPNFKLNIIPGQDYSINRHTEVSDRFMNLECYIPALSLQCNEPFGLVIADAETGKVLFMGAINEAPGR